MNTLCFWQPTRIGGGPRLQTMRWLLGLILLLAGLGVVPPAASASPADDQYLQIYAIIEEGDTLATAEKVPQAIAKYQQADKALKEFRRTFPSYNPKMVTFRLNYLSTQLSKLTQPKLEPETKGDSSASTPAKAVDKNQPQLKLLSPGAEPRTELRLQPQPGDKQSLTMVMKMAMGMEVPGQPAAQNIKIPALKMNLDLEVKDVSANGDIVYAIQYRDFGFEDDKDATPEIVAGLKSALGDFQGLSALGTNTSRGISKGLATKIPADTDPQMRQMLEQMNESLSGLSSPLPEEAVGLGAKWETKMPISSQGMTIEQIVRSELVSLENGRATVKVSLTQRAANQKVSNPNMPGLKLDLDRMSGKGNGESTIDLKHLLPVTAAMDEKTEVVMAFGGGQQKQTMKMTMDLRITMQSK